LAASTKVKIFERMDLNLKAVTGGGREQEQGHVSLLIPFMYIEKANALALVAGDTNLKLQSKFRSLQDLEPLVEVFIGKSTSLEDKAAIVE